MSPGKHDPWVAGKPLDGVTFGYNERVTIISGPYAGREGWLVSLSDWDADPLYTVELADGGPDVDVRQALLRRTA